MSDRIAVLLATFDGEPFLREQLQSLLAQTHAEWVLYWRDDGSADSTPGIMEAFAQAQSPGRVVRVPGPGVRLGSSESFMHLLAAALEGEPDACGFAFADQDDVWLPEKLARGRDALARMPREVPTLYCARQKLVDRQLRELGLSPLFTGAGFPAALAQNVATGCTVLLNRAAALLIASTRPPPASVHDWWSYLLVAAAGGAVVVDPTPVILYRQHAANVVGAPASPVRRIAGALRRGPGAFMALFREHVAALDSCAHLLSPAARRDLAAIQRALRGGLLDRLSMVRMPGLRRQSWQETLLLRCWFLLG